MNLRVINSQSYELKSIVTYDWTDIETIKSDARIQLAPNDRGEVMEMEEDAVI